MNTGYTFKSFAKFWFEETQATYLVVNISLLYAKMLKETKKTYRFTVIIFIRGGVEDTRLEAKAKDTKKIRGQGQGQPFRGQTLSRPRTGMLEAKAKD